MTTFFITINVRLMALEFKSRVLLYRKHSNN